MGSHIATESGKFLEEIGFGYSADAVEVKPDPENPDLPDRESMIEAMVASLNAQRPGKEVEHRRTAERATDMLRKAILLPGSSFALSDLADEQILSAVSEVITWLSAVTTVVSNLTEDPSIMGLVEQLALTAGALQILNSDLIGDAAVC